jgi:hypothetical protein
MADFVFNIAKGRVAEFYFRVRNNDPANSALIIVIIDAAGDTDATMKDRDDLSVLLGGTANEVTNTGYARKTLTDADIVAFAPDDVNDRVDLDIPDQTWTARRGRQRMDRLPRVLRQRHGRGHGLQHRAFHAA